jgi:hypothetical protein
LAAALQLEVPVRRIIRILAVLGVAAVLVAVIRRLMAEGGDAQPPAVPWEPFRPEAEDQDGGASITAHEDVQPGDGADAERGTKVEEDVESGDIADWVEPDADGSCPAAFPVKAKLSSKIFHVPGGQSYQRTGADRCYRNDAAAVADGLRQAKR